MYIGILMINTILGMVILFCGKMVKNHFEKIERSIEIYNDPKIYKNENDISSLSKLISDYHYIREYNDNQIDAYMFVRNYFYQQPIGKFNYMIVENVATKGKWLMWLTFFAGAIGSEYSMITQNNLAAAIYLGASLMLCLLISCIELIYGIGRKREVLLIKVQDYITNVEPVEKMRNKELRKMKGLRDKVYQLEHELAKYQKVTEREVSSEYESVIEKMPMLKERDVAEVLKKINLDV